MPNVLIPILPGKLPQGYCFESWQKLLVDFSNNMQAQLAGSSYYNVGDTKPDPEFQAYPWLYTNDMRWYEFNGVWRSPMNRDLNERRLWVGTTTQLITYDGGSAGVVTPTSGPAWEVDSAFEGRMPIGAGTIPNTAPPVTIAAAATTDSAGETGEYSHILTLDEIPTHNHALQVWDGPVTAGTHPQSYIGTTSQGTYNTNDSGGGLAHNNMPPMFGIYLIKPSGRQFYTVL